MLRDWTNSDKVNKLTVHAERFFIRLIMKADDYGCFHADTRMLKANLFPYLLDSIREADLLRWMDECQKAGLIVLYESESKGYVQIVNFRQRLDKARSKFPLPDANDFPEVVNEFPAEVEPEVEPEKRNNTGAPPAPPIDPVGRKKKKTKENFIPPTIPEFQDYFIKLMGGKWGEARCRNTADLCHDHYVANGWVQAKGKPIVDWQATARQWIRRDLGGDFGKPIPRQEAPKQATASIPAAALTKDQIDINYLYERYLEGPGLVTVISVYSEHYNLLKKSGLISFSDEETAAIEQRASAYLVEKKIASDAEVMLKYKKRFGVLEFFKQHQQTGQGAIFYVVNAPA